MSRRWIGQTLVDTFTREFGEDAPALVDAYLTWNLANLERLVEPYPGVDDLLRALDAGGVRTGVVTSKRRSSAERTLAAVGLAGAIDLLTTMDDTVQHKPSPEPLLHAVRTLGVRPCDCVYVGDAVFDVQAAQAAGLDAIGVTWGAGEKADLEAARPHAVVETVDELRRVLLG